MYCKHCLANNPQGATVCAQCGASLADAIPGAPPGTAELELQDHAPEQAPATGGPVSPEAPSIGMPIGGPPPSAEEKKKKEEGEPPPMPPDNKMWAIGTIIGAVVGTPCACCTCYGAPSFFALIFGLLALLESGKIKPFYEDKAYDAALEASKKTKTFAIIGIAVFVGMMLLGFVISLALHGLGFLTNWQNQYNIK